MTSRRGEVEDAKLAALFSTGRVDYRDTSTKACRHVHDNYFIERGNYDSFATRYKCTCSQWEVDKSWKSPSAAKSAPIA
jgi:hypothetical protein